MQYKRQQDVLNYEKLEDMLEGMPEFMRVFVDGCREDLMSSRSIICYVGDLNTFFYYLEKRLHLKKSELTDTRGTDSSGTQRLQRLSPGIRKRRDYLSERQGSDQQKARRRPAAVRTSVQPRPHREGSFKEARIHPPESRGPGAPRHCPRPPGSP